MTVAKCEQVGCGGTIDGGFCDRCGLEPTGGGTAVATRPSAATGSFATGSFATGRASTGSRRGSGSVRTSTRGHLGLGFVTVPGLPTIDPATTVMPTRPCRRASGSAPTPTATTRPAGRRR